jgi:hypothetical protein
MTNLLGTIKDSAGNVITGTLTVSLPAPIVDDSTTPDSIQTTKEKEFDITAGVIDIDIPQSEDAQISYHFKFVDADGVTRLEFDAIVPDIGEYQFGSLVPTGIVNDVLDSGAFRVAKRIVEDPLLAALVKPNYTATLSLEAANSTRNLYIPKPFSNAILIKEMSVLAVVGYNNWTFQLGVINSSGNEETLTPSNTTTQTIGGKRKITYSYNLQRAGSIMGMFIRCIPGTPIETITAGLLLVFTDVPA